MTIGKYLVIKYRLGDEANQYLQLQLKINGSSQMNQTVSAANLKRDEWMIAVIDISSYTQAPTDGVTKFWARFQHFDTLDVAYVALVEDLTAVGALLEEGETYVDCGNTMVNIGTGTEYNKDGTPVTTTEE